MKLTSKIIAPGVIIIIIGGILLSMGLNVWKTKGSKIPARYSSGRFEGAYNPADIRGSYSFGDIAASFDVSALVLAKAFGFENTDNQSEILAKDLESLYGEMDGGEIGTDSVRFFVALYTGRPYTPESHTLMPMNAIVLLKDRVSDDTYADLEKISVTLPETRPTYSGSEEHDSNTEAAMIKGKTTFGDLKSWGLNTEEIETAIGMEIGKSGVTIREHVTGNGKSFGEVKANLQSILDSM